MQMKEAEWSLAVSGQVLFGLWGQIAKGVACRVNTLSTSSTSLLVNGSWEKAGVRRITARTIMSNASIQSPASPGRLTKTIVSQSEVGIPPIALLQKQGTLKKIPERRIQYTTSSKMSD